MTSCEMENWEMGYRISVVNGLKAIANELKKSNELRAVEMRLRCNPGEYPRTSVDEIMENEP